MSISFIKLGKFSFIIFSNRLPISCSLSSPSGTPMKRMLDRLKLSQWLLTLSSFFWILFSSCCSHWLFLVPCVPNYRCDSRVHPLYCCFPVNCSLFQLVNPSFPTIFFMLLRSSLSSLSILLTIWPLHLIDCLSSFCLVLFLEFWSVLSFGPCFFVLSF